MSANRVKDDSTIVFNHLGVSLSCLLATGLDDASRVDLQRLWYDLPGSEDSAPWNILLSSRGNLLYIDQQSLFTSGLNSNWMLTTMQLEGCSWDEGRRKKNPVSVYHQCIISGS